jgi:hypothetical protein
MCHGPPVVALQQACPEPLGSQEPPALSRKVPLLGMPLEVCRAGIPGVVARSEVALACGAAGTSHLTFRREEYETIKFYKIKN